MTLLEDDRPIASLWYGEDLSLTVGKGNITKIQVYGEPGMMSLLPWFEIHRDGVVLQRVNAAMIETVMYEKDSE